MVRRRALDDDWDKASRKREKFLFLVIRIYAVDGRGRWRLLTDLAIVRVSIVGGARVALQQNAALIQ